MYEMFCKILSIVFICDVIFLLFPVYINGLQCHSCSGKADCESLITQNPNLSGRCQIDNGQGKCFIRKDPNNVIYWGCIDDIFWPGVRWRDLNGCEADWVRAWERDGVRQPMIWCFCDRDDCNVSIQKVNNTKWDELDKTTAGSLTTMAATSAAPSTLQLTTLPAVTSQTAAPVTSRAIAADPCPPDFLVEPTRKFCIKVVSPTDSTRYLSRSYLDASRECSSFNAHLAAVDSTEKQQFLASILSSQPRILDGWQGWWTSGQFVSGVNQFTWLPFNKHLPFDSNLWGFKQAPVRDTCIWIMSIAFYNHSLANYDCSTKAGYVCEIDLAI